MITYIFQSEDKSIDIHILTDACKGNDKSIITQNPVGKGLDSFVTLGFPYVNGVQVNEKDLVTFAHQNILNLYRFDENFPSNGTQLIGPIIEEWDYVFTVSPRMVRFTGQNQIEHIEVVSTKQRKLNGTDQGTAIKIPYEVKFNGPGVIWDEENQNLVTAISQNSHGTAHFIQSEGVPPITVYVEYHQTVS